MKYRILEVKENENIRFVPQYRYRFIPYWLNFVKWAESVDWYRYVSFRNQESAEAFIEKAIALKRGRTRHKRVVKEY